MKKYLVTGAMGFIGSHWCEHLLKQGHKVYGIDIYNSYPKLHEYDNFIFIQDSITNYALMKEYINKSDFVFHFASIAEPKQYIESPRKVISVAGIAALSIIDFCRMAEKKIMFTSTSEIYGKNPKLPFNENDDRVLGPTSTKRWCYSSSKALAEHYLYACADTKELDFIIVRLFNVYGPRLKGRVVSNFVNNCDNDEDIYINEGGKQTRAFTYVDDVISAFELLYTNPNCLNNDFNIGNTKETSINDLAKIVLDLSNTKSQIIELKNSEFYGKSYEDINRRVPDISKIEKFVKWKPKISLNEGISKMIAYSKNK